MQETPHQLHWGRVLPSDAAHNCVSTGAPFMEYGNGIVGDMCVHMFDTARWMLGLGWPKRITSAGGIYVQKEGKSNISDTQTATFEYEGLNCVWTHRTWGNSPDPKYPWAITIHGDKGMLKAAPANRLHMRDLLAAIASRGKPIADIEEGHISTANR